MLFFFLPLPALIVVKKAMVATGKSGQVYYVNMWLLLGLIPLFIYTERRK